MNLNKNHRHELGIEMARNRENQKQVDNLRDQNSQLEKLLKVMMGNVHNKLKTSSGIHRLFTVALFRLVVTLGIYEQGRFRLEVMNYFIMSHDLGTDNNLTDMVEFCLQVVDYKIKLHHKFSIR